MGVAYGSFVSQYVPQFFANVRSERSKRDDELFQNLFPVSYTHLDVYKRQQMYLAVFSFVGKVQVVVDSLFKYRKEFVA